MMWPKCCVSIVHRGTTTFHTYKSFQRSSIFRTSYAYRHGLRTPREEIAYTARPKIQSQSQIFRYGGSIFCLPHRPIFSDILDLCLHWVSVVRGLDQTRPQLTKLKWLKAKLVAVCAISSLFQMSGLMVH